LSHDVYVYGCNMLIRVKGKQILGKRRLGIFHLSLNDMYCCKIIMF
jgi:hypothetical protein